MATEDLKIRITAQLASIKSGLQHLERELTGLDRKGKKATETATRGTIAAGRAADHSAVAFRRLGVAVGAAFSFAAVVHFTRSLIDANKEAQRIHFTFEQAFGANAAKELAFVSKLADKLGLSYADAADAFGQLGAAAQGTAATAKDLEKIFIGMNEAATVLHTPVQDVTATFVQLSQGISLGKLQMQDIRAIAQHLPGTMVILNKAAARLGTTLEGALAHGGLDAVAMLSQIGDVMQETFGPKAQEASHSLNAEINRLHSTLFRMQTDGTGFADSFASAVRSLNIALKDPDTQAALKTMIREFGKFAAWAARALPPIVSLLLKIGPPALAIIAAFRGWRIIAPIIATVTASIRAHAAATALDTTAMKAAAVQAQALTAAMTAEGAAASIAGTKTMRAMKLAVAGIKLLGAYVIGWEIGTWLREKFDGVRLAGAALVAGLLKAWSHIKQGVQVTGLEIELAFEKSFNFVLKKIDDIKKKVADFFNDIPFHDKIFGAHPALDSPRHKFTPFDTSGIDAQIKDIVAKARAARKKIDDALFDTYEAERRAHGLGAQPAAGAGAGKAKPPAKPKGPSAAVLAAAAAAAAKLAKVHAGVVEQSTNFAIAQLQRLYDGAGISIANFYKQKQALQLKSLDAQVRAARAGQNAIVAARTAAEAAARKGAGTDKAAQAAAASKAATKYSAQLAQSEGVINGLLLQRKTIVADVAAAQAKADKDLADKARAVSIELLQQTGHTSEAVAARMKDRYADYVRKLRAELGGANDAMARATLADIDRLIGTSALQAQLNQAQTLISEAVTKVQNVESSTGAQVQAGMMSQGDAEDRVQTAREQGLQVLLRQRDALQQVAVNARAAGDAMTMREAQAALTTVNGQIATMAVNTASLKYQASQALTEAFTDLFASIANGSKSAGEALRDFVRSFASAMVQLAARALAMYAVLLILNAIPGGSAVASALSIGAKVKHAGGIVGGGGSRWMPAFAFAGAPRYATGGIAGLAPDEVPAVLHRGEEVLTKNDPRHRNNGGMGGDDADPSKGVRFVFVDDQRDVGNYLESSRGERTIVRIMERNKLR